jgi:hypothetical protein
MTNDQASPEGALSYATDVKPLFRARDRDAMRQSFDLWSYDDVRSHGSAIEEKLSAGSMPCDGPWPAAKVATFTHWLSNGAAP